jgi:hypothetical protein
MARPRKIVNTDKLGNKLAGALPDAWWRWKADPMPEPDEDSNDDISWDSKSRIIIYTTQNLKVNIEPMAFYFYPNGETAVQYKVEEDSKEHKELFKLLKLNDSHEKKPPRKKRITKAEKEVKESNGEVKKRKRKKAE